MEYGPIIPDNSAPSPVGEGSLMPFPANLRQWVCWRGKGKRKIPIRPCMPGNMYSHVTHRAPISVTDRTHWGSLSAARARLANGRGAEGLGFVLTKDDPYVLIDLDVPLRKNVKGVDGETIQRCKIAHDLGTYTEVSPGGGWHCYVEMTEPLGTFTGVKLESCEVYYAKRFTTVSGNIVTIAAKKGSKDKARRMSVVRKMSREELGAVVPGLAHRLNAPDCVSSTTPPVPNGSPLLDIDIEIWAVKVSDEANKNNRHYDLSLHGKWSEYGFPSQSEADFEVCRHLAVACKKVGAPLEYHRGIVGALFSASALAKRTKAEREDYVNRTMDSVFAVLSTQKT